MLGILAYYHNAAFSLDYLALFADLLYGWFNLHFIIPTLSLLLGTPGYTSLCEVVYGNLYGHLLSRQDSYIVHSELSRNMSRYYMPIGKLHLEGRIG